MKLISQKQLNNMIKKLKKLVIYPRYITFKAKILNCYKNNKETKLLFLTELRDLCFHPPYNDNSS